MKGYDSEEHIEYILENYNTPILEAFNMEKKKQEIQIERKGFIKYLKYKYPGFDPNEITGAKSVAERKAVVKKYKKDYEFWVKDNKKQKIALSTELLGLVAELTGFNGIALVLYVICFGISIDGLRKELKEKQMDRRNEK